MCDQSLLQLGEAGFVVVSAKQVMVDPLPHCSRPLSPATARWAGCPCAFPAADLTMAWCLPAAPTRGCVRSYGLQRGGHHPTLPAAEQNGRTRHSNAEGSSKGLRKPTRVLSRHPGYADEELSKYCRRWRPHGQMQDLESKPPYCETELQKEVNRQTKACSARPP